MKKWNWNNPQGVIIPYKNVKYFGGQQKLLYWKRNEWKSLFLGDGSRWYPCFGLLVTSFQGFKSQGGFLICMLHCLHAVASSYSTVVIDLLTSWWPTLQPSLFLSTYFFKHWWDSGSSVQHSVHSNHLSHSRSTSHIKYLVFITFTKRGNKVSTIHCNQSGPTGSEKKENYLKRNCNQYQYSEWRCTKRLNFGWSVTPFYRTLKLVAKYKQSGHLHKEGLRSGSDNLRRY